MLGCVNDIEIDTCSARITSIIIYGKYRFLGLLGKEEDIIIPWRDIKVIGEDVVLVKYEHFEVKKKRIFTLWKDLFK